MTSTQIYLLCIGIVISFASFIGIIIAFIPTGKKINYLWQSFSKKTYAAYDELYQNITKRMDQYHDGFDSHDNLKSINLPNLKFRHSAVYLLRFSLIFIISSGIYPIFMVYLFGNIQSSLETQTEVVFNSYKERVLLLKVYFWVIESTTDGFNCSLANSYNGFNPSPDIYSTSMLLINDLHSSKAIFYVSTTLVMLSSEIKTYLFQGNPTDPEYLHIGVLAALDLFMTESFNIVDRIPLESAAKGEYLALGTAIAQELQTISY